LIVAVVVCKNFATESFPLLVDRAGLQRYIFLPVSDPKRRKEINLWNAARKKISPGVTAVMNPVQERESAASASNTI
jgi:hypothetical protein